MSVTVLCGSVDFCACHCNVCGSVDLCVCHCNVCGSVDLCVCRFVVGQCTSVSVTLLWVSVKLCVNVLWTSRTVEQ